jgi:hypothetical protein
MRTLITRWYCIARDFAPSDDGLHPSLTDYAAARRAGMTEDNVWDIELREISPLQGLGLVGLDDEGLHPGGFTLR